MTERSASRFLRVGPNYNNMRIIREGLGAHRQSGHQRIVARSAWLEGHGPDGQHRSRIARDGSRVSRHEFRPLLCRPADLCRRRLDLHHAHRRHRLFCLARCAVPRDCASQCGGDRAIPRCVRGGDQQHGVDASRAGDQRRRRHALHAVAGDQRRQADHHGYIQAWHRSRRGAGVGAEPRFGSGASPSGGSAPPWRDDA